MNSAVCSIVSYVLNAAWQIPLIAGAGWVASRVTRRWGSAPQHRVWAATWLLSLITPILPTCRDIAYSMGLSGRSAETARSSIGLHGAAAVGAVQAGTLPMPAWLIWLIFSLYAGTLIYFAAKLVWLFVGARALVRTSVPVNLNAETDALWQKVQRGFGADARLLASSSIRGVVTIGARRPAIVLPAGFAEQFTEDELLSALGHEMAHVARHDYAKNLLYEISGIFAGFHPVTWMMKARIVQTREMICDAKVVDRLVNTKAYRRSLLRLAERIVGGQPTNQPAVGMFDGNLLRERIMMIKAKKSIPGRLTRIGLAGIAALALLAAAILGTAFAKTVNAQTTNASAPWGTVYKVGKDVTAPKLIYAVDPKYSDQARHAKYQGICVLSLIVDKKGNPRHIEVVRALGMGLDQKAIEAVKQYKFKPAYYHGKPVPVSIDISVNFRLY